MPKLLSLTSILVAIVALFVGKAALTPKSTWHQGPSWDRLFAIYDKMATDQFNDCDSRLIESRFGSTMVHACGHRDNPPVFLFHGLSSCSLMWGDWVVPTLAKTYYAVSVDALCDVTRSLPKDANLKSCPQTPADMFEWMMDIKAQLGLQGRPASLVGYSYGAFMASQIAMEADNHYQRLAQDASEKPDVEQNIANEVGKLILIAPAATLAPIANAWLMRAIPFSLGMSLFRSIEPLGLWLRTWFFGFMMHDILAWSSEQLEIRAALDGAGPGEIAVPPVELEMSVLQDLVSSHEMLLIIGDKETVIDHDVAVGRAKEAGMHVRSYAGAGHMMLVEHPRDSVTLDVLQFLDGTFGNDKTSS